MDYLQYFTGDGPLFVPAVSFKPYYKWITFNTKGITEISKCVTECVSFKPYYKWITFNTH